MEENYDDMFFGMLDKRIRESVVIKGKMHDFEVNLGKAFIDLRDIFVSHKRLILDRILGWKGHPATIVIFDTLIRCYISIWKSRIIEQEYSLLNWYFSK
jgi:hypothetical protein